MRLPWIRRVGKRAHSGRPSCEPLIALLRGWDGSAPLELPDEFKTDRGLRFSAGSLDGIATHHQGVHRGVSGKETASRQLVRAFAEFVARDDPRTREAMYASIPERVEPGDLDELMQGIAERKLARTTVRERARWLLETATDPAGAKVGMALLGGSGTPDDVDDLVTFARHDEFTLQAAVAVENILPDPLDVLWRIARSVHGWGRIHVVKRIAPRVAGRADIKAWLLREGFRNSILDEYLALTCAKAGDLAAALSMPTIDLGLLNGGCGIAIALYAEGAGPGMSEYSDGVAVVRALLGHVERNAASLESLRYVVATRRWVEWPARRPTPGHLRYMVPEHLSDDAAVSERWVQLARLGWTEQVRAEAARLADDALGRSVWEQAVRGALDRGGQEAAEAFEMAPAIGLDVWDRGLALLEADPLDAGWYFRLLRTEAPGRIDRLLTFAEDHLPLEKIAAGPTNSLGMGPEFRPHQCLDFLVQDMQREDVWRPRLVATALRSPVVRNRNMAIKALKSHPRNTWGEQLQAAAEQAVRDEPNEQTRAALLAVLGSAD